MHAPTEIIYLYIYVLIFVMTGKYLHGTIIMGSYYLLFTKPEESSLSFWL